MGNKMTLSTVDEIGQATDELYEFVRTKNWPPFIVMWACCMSIAAAIAADRRDPDEMAEMVHEIVCDNARVLLMDLANDTRRPN